MGNKPHSRRWFRYSLRTLFVITTLIAIGIVVWPKSSNVEKSYEAFVKAIEDKRFQDAYQMLSIPHQKRYSYVQFKDFYSKTGPPDDPISQVYTHENEAHIICHPPGKSESITSASFSWKKINGEWRLDEIIYYFW